MNGKGKFTLRISTMCFGIALVTLAFTCVVWTVSAQHAPGYSLVYNGFSAATGSSPSGTIALDSAGNIYGTTVEGVNQSTCGDGDGCGTIFKISSTGQQTILHTFTSGSYFNGVGANGVIRAANGTLYGTTLQGGASGVGTVFKLTSSGSYGVLHHFTGGATDGSEPSAVVAASSGNLYGTTTQGGGTGCSPYPGCGTIYKVTPSGTETVLYSFTGGTDGREPGGTAVLDSTGNLYGTASVGGDLSCSLGDGEGCGTVWELDTSGNLTVLYSFTGSTDGAAPSAGVIRDSSGNLYGDTPFGGDLSCDPPLGCGVVFEINSSGNFSVLHTFVGGANDGESPLGALLRDSAGNLYGTAVGGGDQSCISTGSGGCGVVFKIANSGGETILHTFTGSTTDGAQPRGALISNGKGTLYGTTQEGGTANGGVIFAVRE
jgi:uncharacterized repeat protein (TIGR03803 family)